MSSFASRLAVCSVVGLAVAAGCALSESRYPLPVSPAEAPSTFGPIAQCAKNAGMDSTVSDKKDSIQVFTKGAATIVFRISEGQFFEEISILSDTDMPEADRQAKIKEAKPVADQIWACADAARKNPPATAASSATP
jgi:hypothetical protein